MPGNLTIETLKQQVAAGEIDTVITAIPDMQGRLMGKRFQAEFFLESAWEETHCCNYLIATDLEMYTVDGYRSTRSHNTSAVPSSQGRRRRVARSGRMM